MVATLTLGSSPCFPQQPGRVTASFTNRDIRFVLREIALQARVAIVHDETLAGTVTATLENVPLPTALDLLCESSGHRYVEEGPGRYRVLSAPTAPGVTPMDPLYVFSQDVLNGHLREVRLTLQAHPGWVNRELQDGPPLYCAAGKGFVEMCAELIQRGAHVNAWYGQLRTALHAAVRSRNQILVLALIRAGADPNARRKISATYSIEPPLFEAVRCGDLQMVRLLVRHGADPDLKGSNDATVLAQGLNMGTQTLDPSRLDMIRALLACGADPNVPMGFIRYTVLHEAAGSLGSYPLQRAALPLFLAGGADPNAQSRSGETPLHVAAREGNVHAVELLLKAGASVRIRNHEGRTPLDVAFSSRHSEIVRLLRRRGGR